jgi:tripartite-type tricarboxylate transporter receptor subunit TctC
MQNPRYPKWLSCAVLSLSLCVALGPTRAMGQGAFPERPITLMVGHSPGGNTDLGLRILAEAASNVLGKPVVVENKPGGNSFLAFVTVMNSKPDGYTIGDYSTMKYDLSVMYEKVPRKVEDASVIGMYWSIVHGVAVKGDSPFNTFKDLVEYARANPGKVTYAVPNAGSPPHLAMEWVGKNANINWKAVPYKGLAPAVPALLGGHVTAIAGLAGAHLEQVKAGNMKLLAVTGGTRLPGFPNVPTLKELGYDIEVQFDIGLVAPKGVPDSVLKTLRDAFAQAARDPKFVKFVGDNQMPLTYMDGDQYAKYLNKAVAVREPLLRELGLAFKE